MRNIFFVLPFTFCISFVLGQTDSTNKNKLSFTRLTKGDSIKIFIDSLKMKVLNDTLKFNHKDLVNIDGWTENKISYSTLIIVDQNYAYRLDIIKGTMVTEFTNEILRSSNIDTITIIKAPLSMEMYGPQGNNGAIIISLNRGSKLNLKVAGLKYNKARNGGDNFNQRKKGEIMIRS